MTSIIDIIENVGRVICLYQENSKTLSDFSISELSYFPLNYLIKYVKSLELEGIWEKLPENYRNDEELKRNLPCHLHYNQPEYSTHIDGPPPPIRECYICRINIMTI